ncbi:glycosyltransferase [bacterium]|nr:MAG: glycosyltransferase [bacterium]
MSNKLFSLLTITHNRNDHLTNLLRGAEQSTRIPSEIIVVYMNQPEEINYASTIPIHSIHIDDADHSLPLAKARNKALESAAYENLVFLDVDCIPSPDMFDVLLNEQSFRSSLVMGSPRYLKPQADLQNHELSSSYLLKQSVTHESRRHIPFGLSDRYELFWSLCFGLTKQTYQVIGGFDEMFTGYGGEDTDFSFSARRHNVPFVISPALCFHQHHAVYKPPVQHLEDIVINSRQFYQKWRIWSMEGWLQKFVELGFIEWSNTSEDINIVYIPTSQSVSKFEDATSPY